MTEPVSRPGSSRRPWLAALLSLVVPGLGQLYTGRLRRAATLYLLCWLAVCLCLVLIVKLPRLSLLVPLFLLLLLRVIWIPGDAFAAARKTGAHAPSLAERWYVYVAVMAFDLILIPLVIAPAVLLPLMTTWVQAFLIPSGGMESTLLVGDYILVDRTAYRLSDPIIGRVWLHFADPRRGEVVVFRFPHDPSRMFVKRVIGLPGETVEIRQGVVFINGLALDESYAKAADPPPVEDSPAFRLAGDWGPDRVPPGHVFVLGDNRDNSRDSRSWGHLPIDDVLGRVVRIYWSQEWLANRSSGGGTIRWERLGRIVE